VEKELKMTSKISRRCLIGKTLGVSAGLAAATSFEHRALLAQLSARREGQPIEEEPVQDLPMGSFGGRKVSRLVIGGNLISGSAHAGEIVYQSDFMTHYFDTDRIFKTWTIAERNGINTTLMRCDPHIIEHYGRFLRERGGKLHWITQTAPEQGDPVQNAKLARDNGSFAVYLHGGVSDGLVEEGKVDQIGEAVEGFKKLGVFSGVAAHKLETIQAVEKAAIDPDFYMFTINKVNYLSSDPTAIDNYMEKINRPWIGFKVLGAGRDHPKEGFRHAFQRGADLIAVGMFDWQVRNDSATAKELLAGDLERRRPWRA
jgi:hypothetical protein